MLSSWVRPSSRVASIILCPGPSAEEAKTVRVKRTGGPEEGEEVGVHKVSEKKGVGWKSGREEGGKKREREKERRRERK